MDSAVDIAILASGPGYGPAEAAVLEWARDTGEVSLARIPGGSRSRSAGRIVAELAREATYPGNWRRPLRSGPSRWSEAGLPDGRGTGVLVDCGADLRAVDLACRMGMPLVQLQVAGGDWRRWGADQVLAGSGACPFRIVHRVPDGTERVLQEGAFPTRWSPRATAYDIAERAGRQLVRVLQDLDGYVARAVTDSDGPQQEILGDRETESASAHVGSVRRTLRQAASMVVTERRRREAPWHVAVTPGPWRSADLRQARELPNPPGGWLADPHRCSWQGVEGLFVEQFDHLAGRGHIAWMPWNDADGGPTTPVIEEQEHLSFPWTFDVGDRLFMTMESGQARRLRVYECRGFPGEWEPHSDFLVGVEAVDPIIVERPDGWFLLVNIDSCDAGEPGNELYVFVADDPLAGRWQELPGNPQVIDPRRARNGGLLRDGNDLYRVAQRHGFRTYGEACQVMRVLRLDRGGYREAEVAAFDLGGGRGPHTLTGDATHLVFDVHDVPS